MPITVDPNAPRTWRDWVQDNKILLIGHAISAAFTLALLACLWAPQAVWLGNLVFTVGWLLYAVVLFAAGGISFAWGYYAINGDDLAKSQDPAVRKSLADLSRSLRLKGAPTRWLGRIAFLFQVVLLYMLEWTTMGALFLVTTLIMWYFTHMTRKTCEDILLKKLSAE